MKGALAVACAVALVAPAPALAVYQCGDTKDDCPCAANNPYPCCDNGGNCTWYAWEAACCNWGKGLPGWGNANQWAGNARANASYQVLNYPVTNAVTCRDVGTYGHVAYSVGINGSSTVTVHEQNCWGNYGMDTHTFQASYFTGGYIVRSGQVACRPGDSQTQSCGNCGTQTRGCGADGSWQSFGACSSQGECAPGQEDSQACGTCGTQARTCTASCQWSSYGACAGPDPVIDGGSAACDTGQKGVCGAGHLACVSGDLSCQATVKASAEACDGVDNDCDGVVDGAAACVGAAPVADTAWAPEPSTKAQGGGLSAAYGGCSAAGGGLALELLAVVAAGLFRSRRVRID